MFCHNCGKQIPDGTKFCRYCGAAQYEVQGAPASASPSPMQAVWPQPASRPVASQESASRPVASQESAYGPNVSQESAYGNMPQVYNAPDAPDNSISVGLVILSVFIPVFGLIYWPVKAKTRPKCARACGIASLIAWGLGILGAIA